MWKLVDSNKIVGQKMKVDSYKRHMTSLKNVKCGIKIEQPWKPTFSLSKRMNKYHKYVESRISKQNQNLLTRMLKLETEPMTNTINIIPKTIPSNKDTFLELKARERKAEGGTIRHQNMKILDKLENANSDYNSRALSQEWKENQKYREIIIKKECVPDYLQLVRREETIMKSRISRPRTAFAPLSKAINEQNQ